MIRAAVVRLGVRNRVSPRSRVIGPAVPRRVGRCRPPDRARRVRPVVPCPVVPHRAGVRRVVPCPVDVVRRVRRRIVSRGRRPAGCRRVGRVSLRSVRVDRRVVRFRRARPVRAGRRRVGPCSLAVPARPPPAPRRSCRVPAAPTSRLCVPVSPGPCAARTTIWRDPSAPVVPPRPRGPEPANAPVAPSPVNGAPPRARPPVNVAPRAVHHRRPVRATAATAAEATTGRVAMARRRNRRGESFAGRSTS